MKKRYFIFSIFTLALFLTGCSIFNSNSDEPNNTENIEDTKTETTNETFSESINETLLENEKQDEVETDIETVEETKVENEKQEKEILEIENQERDDETSETIDITKSDNSMFNNKLTSEMQERISNFSSTLIESDSVIKDLFPKENLQAIAKYENDESFGWVVRYGVNKIGLAQYYKESTTNVLVIQNGELLLEKNSLIKNDSPEEFKEIAQQIIVTQISGTADIEFAY